VNLAADAGLIKINLNVLGFGNLLAAGAARDVFAFPTSHANGQQPIAGNNPGSGSGRSRLNRFGDDSLRSIDPGNAVRGRWVEPHSLRKVQRAGSNQQRRRYQQQPSSACQY